MEERVDTGLLEAASDPSALREDAPAPVAVAPVVEEDLEIAVTAAVTAPEEPRGLTPEGVQAAKSLLSLPQDLTPEKLSKLAREVAADIKDLGKILSVFKLTLQQYEFLKEYNEYFKQALAHATIEWNSALSTPERIKLQAAAIMEEHLPELAVRMAKPGEGLPGVVEAGKLVAKIAGLGEREAGNNAAPGERFVISINLGAGQTVVHQTKDVTPASPQAPAGQTLQIDTKG